MNNPGVAKTRPKRESIVEHTNNLFREYKRLKRIYPEIKNINWDILKIACLYHDLGKLNTKFQNKLLKKLGEELLEDKLSEIDEIPHGYLSPAFLPKKELKSKFTKDERRILYQSIYYHHSRRKLENSNELKQVIKEDLNRYYQDFKYDKIGEIKKIYPSFSRYVKRRIPDARDSKEIFYQYIMTKGLLNKIDYAASGGVEIEVKNDNLFEKTDASLRDEGYEPNELQEYMIEHQNENNVIIASTGIGKTEAALFWIGNSKGFFTLPLKVSINAIYDRVIDKDKIGFEKEKTALLHSDTMSELLKRNKQKERDGQKEEFDLDYYDKIKQLSLPLTICTLDQLMDFIFKYEGFELKLATLAYSKLIIDEVQMYSADLVAYLIVALKYISEIGGQFSIVTATLPNIFIDFMRKEKIPFVMPKKPYLKRNEAGQIQLRHRIKVFEESINVKHIKENYYDKKVLVIVNTVKKAQEIYEELKNLEEAEVNLLHSRFIRRDRVKKEDNILNLGKKENKDTGIWVTTQVVEASLDIDFDVLYTELSDVCGLLQRMGRVYRSRDLIDDRVNVYVYSGEKDESTSGIRNGKKSIVDIEIFKLSKEAIKVYDGKQLNEADKMELVEKVYNKEKLKDSNYYKQIKETINYAKNIEEYEFKKSEVKLRRIFNESVIPKLIYDEEKDMIDEKLEIIKNSKDFKEKQVAKDKIKELIVDIPLYEYETAYENGRIVDKLEINKFTIFPIIQYDYSFEKGLTRPDINNFDPEIMFI